MSLLSRWQAKKEKNITQVLFNNLDCTRDIARIEQLSIILRTVDKDTVKVEEYFIGFIAAEILTPYILSEPNKLRFVCRVMTIEQICKGYTEFNKAF